MTALGLDLGTTTGWAISCHGVVVSGSIKFQHKPKELWGLRFYRFAQWLKETLGTDKPVVVFYEHVRRHGGTIAAHVYGGFLAQLRAILDTQGIKVVGLSVGTIKKTGTGKGNASKDEMVAAAKSKWPDQDIKTHDQADALWILETGITQL